MPSLKLIFLFGILFQIFASHNSILAKERYSDQHLEYCQTDNFSKIFTTPDKILITPNEIHIYSKENDKLIKGVYIGIENNRVYVAVSHEEETNTTQSQVARGPCGLHRVWHRECGGCGVLLCPMNCTCFD